MFRNVDVPGHGLPNFLRQSVTRVTVGRFAGRTCKNRNNATADCFKCAVFVVCAYVIDTCGHWSRVGHPCSGQFVVQGIVLGCACEPESSVRPSICSYALWRCNTRHRQWKINKEILKTKWNVKLAGSAKGRTDTGLFISPSGISELDCATTKTDTAERSISIGRESLQVFFVLGSLAYF